MTDFESNHKCRSMLRTSAVSLLVQSDSPTKAR
jgi:hypothetical protein